MSKKYLEGTKIEDLTGMKFGEWTVIEFDWNRYESDKIKRVNGDTMQYRYCWICKCSCGKTASVKSGDLKFDKTKSCGLCYTFEDWCLYNEHKDYLGLWDYDKNNCKPNEIGFGSNKKYWFKCEKGIHNSELWLINSLTTIKSNGNPNTTISCRACNSVGQYLIKRYNNTDMWSGNNDVDPFTVARSGCKKYTFICTDCGCEKSTTPANLVNLGLCCNKCSDGQSYPNKFITAFLSQLNIEFETEKVFSWSNNKRYDHYIPNKIIIENHGGQHYEETSRGRSLEDEQENDAFKKQIAKDNGIKHYVVLDCRNSELEFVKNSIMNSQLPTLLNFNESDIDWVVCGEYAEKNLVKEVCEYWNNKEEHETTYDLANIFNMSRTTIARYLKRGTMLGWCNYNGKEEIRKRYDKVHTKNSKLISCGGKIFLSIRECEKYYNIPQYTMGKWLLGKRKTPQKFIELGLKYV